MRYAVVIAEADANYSACQPDLPGSIATGVSIGEVQREIRAAIQFHIDGLRADGQEVPQPTGICEYVET